MISLDPELVAFCRLLSNRTGRRMSEIYALASSLRKHIENDQVEKYVTLIVEECPDRFTLSEFMAMAEEDN